MESDNLLTISDLAREWRLGESTVRRLIQREPGVLNIGPARGALQCASRVL